MTESLHSQSWHRVSAMRPRVRSHAKVMRQEYRGETWYVVQDPFSGRFHRFTPSANLVIGLMDGTRTVQEIWDAASAELTDTDLTQDEVIRLLAQLHASDLLQMNEPPDVDEVARRGEKMQRRKLLMSMVNPLAVRIPMLDPDRFLTRTLPLVGWLFTRFGAVLAFCLIAVATGLAVMNWTLLTENIVDRVLAAESLLILTVTYPVVKAIHELGHGYAIKRWGGEVHEMGLMFLVFIPVPYVDATAATAFRSKWQRALVGGIGIIVEGVLASLALFVWLNAEPGLVRAFAFNVMLIGGVSTLLFNGNPLLRFDGYYVFGDILEIPNLGQRSNRYVGYLIQKYLYGVRGAVSPATVDSERGWLFVYAVSAFVYRLFIMSAIVMFVATKFFVIGTLLAFWGVMMMVGVPLFKGLRYLSTSPALREKRLRAQLVTAGFVAAIVLPVLFLPLPYRTIAEGVIMPAEEAAIYALASGTVQEVLVEPEARVGAGDMVARLADPFLDAELAIVEAEAREFSLRYEVAQVSDPTEAKIFKEQLRRTEAELKTLRERADNLAVRSPKPGLFLLPRAVDMPERFVQKGSLVGFVVAPEVTAIQAVVSQDDADLVRRRLRGVEVRFVGDLSTTIPAEVVREVPLISGMLPSLALSTEGGGNVALDPNATDGPRALEGVMQLEIRPSVPLAISDIGGRVFIRFDHGLSPLGARLYRALRQLFLERFNV